MSLIQQIAAKAFMFVRSRTGRNSPDFEELINLVSKLTTNDVRYDARGLLMFSSRSRFHLLEYTPCVYTEIYEDETMNMSIFGLRESGEIPLHDHPSMYGLLKVIYGKLSLISYTKTNKVHLPAGIETKHLFRQRLNKFQEQSIFPAVVDKEQILTPDDPPVVVCPNDKNLHKVAAVEGATAFFDLLTPPYYPPSRDCHYYAVLSAKDADATGLPLTTPDADGHKPVVWLTEIPVPGHYACETNQYEGDRVDLDSLYNK